MSQLLRNLSLQNPIFSVIFIQVNICQLYIWLNIHQEQPFIRNMQVVSSNRVHSTQACEAYKCRILKPFFFVYQIKGFLLLLSKKKLKKINLRVRFLPLKIAFFGGFENDNILSSKSYTVTKSGISPQRKLGS